MTLVMLDMLTAVDTVDHDILLEDFSCLLTYME